MTREEEIRELRSALEDGKIVILAGEAGIGKSWIVGEYCRDKKCRIGYCDEMRAYSPFNQVLREYSKVHSGYEGGKVALIHEYGNKRLEDLYKNEKGRKVYLERLSKNLEFEAYPKIMDLLNEGYSVFVENFNYIYYINRDIARKILEDGKDKRGKLIFSGNASNIDRETLYIFDEVSLFYDRGCSKKCKFVNRKIKCDIEISKTGDYRIGRDVDPQRLYFELYDIVRQNKDRKILIDLNSLVEYNGFGSTYIWLKDLCYMGANLVIYGSNLKEKDLADISLISNVTMDFDAGLYDESVVMEIAWSKYRLEDPEKEKLKIFDTVTKFINDKMQGSVIVIEDADRCDPTTHEFLSYYARNKDGKTGLIMTLRDEKTAEALLSTTDNCEIIRVGSVKYEEAKKILMELAGDIEEKKMKEIYTQSGGNPLFMIELANIYKKMGEEKSVFAIPDSIKEAVEQKIKMMDDVSYNLVRVASVMGTEIDRDILSKLYPLWNEINHMDEIFSDNKFRSRTYQEVAYSLLPLRIRRDIHSKLGKLYYGKDKFKSCYHHHMAEEVDGVKICLECGLELKEQYSIEESIKYLEYSYSLLKKYKIDGKLKRDICKNLGDLYSLNGRYRDALKVYNEVAGLSLEKGRTYYILGESQKAFKILRNRLRYAAGLEKGRIYGELGSMYYELGKYGIAEKHYKNYLWIAIRENSHMDIAMAYRKLGNIYSSMGNLDIAIKYYDKGYEIAKKYGYLIEMEKGLNNLGGAYFAKHDDEKALKLYKKSREIAEKIGNISDLPVILMNIGMAYGYHGNPERAMEVLLRARDIVWKIGNMERYVDVLSDIAVTLMDLGRFDEAWRYIEEGLDIGEKLKTNFVVVWLKMLFGEIKFIMGEIDEAEKMYVDAAKMARGMNYVDPLLQALVDLGVFYTLTGKKEPISLFEEVAELYKRMGNYIDMVDTMSYIPIYFLFNGNVKKAREIYNKTKKIQASKNLDMEQLIHLQIVEFILKNKRNELKFLIEDKKKKSYSHYLVMLLLLSKIEKEMMDLAVREFEKIGSRWAYMLGDAT